jgi:hypothetical protein
MNLINPLVKIFICQFITVNIMFHLMSSDVVLHLKSLSQVYYVTKHLRLIVCKLASFFFWQLKMFQHGLHNKVEDMEETMGPVYFIEGSDALLPISTIIVSLLDV